MERAQAIGLQRLCMASHRLAVFLNNWGKRYRMIGVVSLNPVDVSWAFLRRHGRLALERQIELRCSTTNVACQLVDPEVL